MTVTPTTSPFKMAGVSGVSVMDVCADAKAPVPPRGSLPISAVIITRNAAARIGEVLQAVEMCAERLVLDSGSTDGTVELARTAGARVEFQPFLGYGPQKRRAVELASYDWILSLDADEVLDEEAQTACGHLDLSNPTACWSIHRRTFVGTHEVKYGTWRGERVLRLFNRTMASFKATPVHEEVESRQPARHLAGSIRHYSFTDCSDLLMRSLRYAPLKASILRAKGERAGAWMLPLRGLAAFVKSYVLRSGWRDGAIGFVVAIGRVIDSTLPRALLLADKTCDDDV
jgi:glycosyltransferase involved in cell wall biosynthesis